MSNPDKDEFKPTHIHKKGGLYKVLLRGVTTDQCLTYEEVVIYQGEDGRIWVRPASMFDDGRFQKV